MLPFMLASCEILVPNSSTETNSEYQNLTPYDRDPNPWGFSDK